MKAVCVQCYSGRTYAERPASFIWRDVTYRIAQVEREWLEPGAKHFLVSTEGGESFELCYNDQKDEWSVSEPGGKEVG